MTFGFSVEKLNLPYLQGDLTTNNKVNEPYYSQGQSQGHRPKKFKKGKKRKLSSNSSGGSSNSPNKSESRYKTSNPSKNQAHSFLTRSYSLELNNSNLKKEFDSDCDSSMESNPFFHKNKANRPKKSGKTKGKKACKNHKFDELLYNTGSTDHIINNRKWFVEFNSNKGELLVLTTGGDPVTLQGQGKAFFRVKTEPNKGYYITFTLTKHPIFTKPRC